LNLACTFKPQTPNLQPDAQTDAPCSRCAQGSTNNATCFVGPHRQYDPFTKSFLNLVPGQGHFGPDAIPGVSSSRIQPIALFPCTFTTQLQPRFRPPVAGCPLAPWGERLPQDGPRHDGRPRARPARSDGLLGALNVPLIVGLRDQEARRVLAAIGGTTVAESGRVCVRVRPPGVLTECVTFKRRLCQSPNSPTSLDGGSESSFLVQSCCGKRGGTFNFYEISFYGSSCRGSDDDPRVGGCPAFVSAGRATPRRCHCRNDSLPTTRCSV
jgi:hypothetical protein